MRTLLLITLLSVGAAAQDVTRDYDRFKDHTMVQTVELMLHADGKYAIVYSDVTVEFGCGFKGREPGGDVAFFINFNSNSREWHFLGRPNELNVLVDSKPPLAMGKGDHSGSVISGGVVEHIYYSTRMADLAAMASAKKVEFQINGFESEFDQGHRNQIDKLLAACTPK